MQLTVGVHTRWTLSMGRVSELLSHVASQRLTTCNMLHMHKKYYVQTAGDGSHRALADWRVGHLVILRAFLGRIAISAQRRDGRHAVPFHGRIAISAQRRDGSMQPLQRRSTAPAAKATAKTLALSSRILCPERLV